ncbi:MAG TPA: hypothetical protein VK279_05910 [Solirubrobacteraceae bacterium]|nr:hypothetical protein [Solirubrobacteraceae bacterium]
MGTISFCMCTRGAAARARALLELLRPVVDEIVVGVDDSDDQGTMDACADLADRRLSFATTGVPCRPIGWILRQCSGDWILRLDDDEAPSARLLDELPALIAERDVTHVALRRWWLWPDATRRIVSPPWGADHQVRLTRNIPSLWTTTGRLHDNVVVQGDMRYTEAAVHHLDLIVEPLAARERKAISYSAERPHHDHEGVPVNAIYVPEHWDGVRTAGVPAADASLVAALLDPQPVPAVAAAPRDPAPGRAELADLDRYNTLAPFPGDGYAARIAFVEPIGAMGAGLVRSELVEVDNLGTWRWPAGLDGSPEIRLACRWRRADGTVLDHAGPRTGLPAAVEPAASTRAKLLLHTPEEPGSYLLEVDLVHEHVRWFGAVERVAVEVEGPPPPRPAPPVGARERFARRAREAGVDGAAAAPWFGAWEAALAWDAMPLGDGRPVMTFAAAQRFAAAVDGARVFEWGAGGSTILALGRAAHLTTVECDAHWAGQVAERVGAGGDRWTVRVVSAAVDDAARGADPSVPEAAVSASPAFSGFSFADYVAAIGAERDGSLDVVLVSGRARPGCLMRAVSKLRPGGLLVLDHAERPWYGRVAAELAAAGWPRTDFSGPGPYAERFWITAMWRKPS